MFFQEQLLRHVAFVDKKQAIKPIQSVGIVGGGLMGSGITIAIAKRGNTVIMVEVDASRQEATNAAVYNYFNKQYKQKKIDKQEMQACIARISVSTIMADLSNVDLVIEAVFEDMQVKKDVFKQLGEIAKPEAVLASNTSGLDINELAVASGRPQQVVGMHFFSPAPVMKLVEVVRADKSAADVMQQTIDFTKHIKKLPVVVNVCPGFVGNRMVIRCLKQVEYLLLRGVQPEQIDKALMDFGFAMGPCAMADMSGLEIAMHMIPGDTLAAALVKAGRLGQKNHAGFYDYKIDFMTASPSVEAKDVIEEYANSLGIDKASFSDADIVQRCVLALVDEAVAIMAEGVVSRAGSIDMVYIYGYGFPAYRGGPVFYADSLGLDKVFSAISAFKKEDAKQWRLHPLLKQCLDSKKSLNQFKSG